MSVLVLLGQPVSGFLLSLLPLQDFHSHVVYRAVVEDNNSSLGTRFYVDAAVFTEIIVAATEVVADCLNCCVETVGDLVHRAVGKTVFEPT